MKKTLSVSVVLALVIAACGGSASPPVSPADVAKALCVASVVKAAGDPRALSPEAAVALASAVAVCVAPAPSEGDAGAR